MNFLFLLIVSILLIISLYSIQHRYFEEEVIPVIEHVQQEPQFVRGLDYLSKLKNLALDCEDILTFMPIISDIINVLYTGDYPHLRPNQAMGKQFIDDMLSLTRNSFITVSLLRIKTNVMSIDVKPEDSKGKSLPQDFLVGICSKLKELEIIGIGVNEVNNTTIKDRIVRSVAEGNQSSHDKSISDKLKQVFVRFPDIYDFHQTKSVLKENCNYKPEIEKVFESMKKLGNKKHPELIRSYKDLLEGGLSLCVSEGANTIDLAVNGLLECLDENSDVVCPSGVLLRVFSALNPVFCQRTKSSLNIELQSLIPHLVSKGFSKERVEEDIISMYSCLFTKLEIQTILEPYLQAIV